MTTPPQCRSRARRYKRARLKEHQRLMDQGRTGEARALVEHVLFDAGLPWHRRRHQGSGGYWPQTGAWVWLNLLSKHLGGDYRRAMLAQEQRA